jgi:LmbE family N-acetylglucosaminyl deacetylase
MNLSGRLLVISPHLDDAVLSCALLLAAHPAAAVCTIFTSPPDVHMTTDWDRDSGFADAFEAMRARKAEDVRALAELGASPIHLPFCDAQYLTPPSREALSAALRDTFMTVQPATLLVPLGLFHSDHTMVADACLASLRSFEGAAMLAYEDVPYRKIPGMLQHRLSALLEHGFTADPVDLPNAGADARHARRKQIAIDRYESQLRAFGPQGRAGLVSEERYWVLRATSKRGRARS